MTDKTHGGGLDWMPQGLALVVVAALGTLPFWLTDLDILVASIFYHPGADDPWPDAQLPLWSLLYSASPLLAGFVTLGSLLVLAAGGVWPSLRRLRCYAILLIASTLLGPGLIVNGLFKDHWGRPRPHQVEQLGGTREYVPPLALSERGKGKSFPCGHSSIGYLLGAFFMIWRRRRPRLAWSALAGSILLGSLLGIGRMAAGDHFVSDVIWSAVIAYGIAWLLYYFVLRIPDREVMDAAVPTSLDPIRSRRAVIGYGAVAAVTLVGVLAATPLKNVRTLIVRPGDFDPAPRVLRLLADEASIILFAAGGDDLTAKVRLEARGFGLPWSTVGSELSGDPLALTYRVRHSGVFTEKDTKVAVGVIISDWDRVEIRIGSGDIRIHPPEGPFPEVDAVTGDGEVVWIGS